MYMCDSTSTSGRRMRTCAPEYVFVLASVYVYTYEHIYVRVCVSMYMCSLVCMCLIGLVYTVNKYLLQRSSTNLIY